MLIYQKNYRHTLLALMIMSAMSANAYCQIVADPNAATKNRPDIQQLEDGRVLVNIQSPNNRGLSINHYDYFDVAPSGVVLNNLPAGATEGNISGNPHISNKSADAIINVVNPAHPAHLEGLLTVAGSSANLIIVSPGGIYCNGADFKNEKSVTLAAARLHEDRAYQVDNGVITIESGGVNSKTIGLIARSIKLDGAVYGERVQIITGASQISPSFSVLNQRKPSGTSPEVAITISNKGLLSSPLTEINSYEPNTSVKILGQVLAVGTTNKLHIAAQGNIENHGYIMGSGNLSLDSGAMIYNDGNLIAGEATELIGVDVYNEGKIFSDNTAKVKTRHHFTNLGELRSNHQSVTIESEVDVNNSGSVISNNSLNISGENLFNSLGVLVAEDDINLTAQFGVDNSGAIIANNQIAISATQLNSAGELALLAGKNILFNQHALSEAEKQTLITGQEFSLTKSGMPALPLIPDSEGLAMQLSLIAQPTQEECSRERVSVLDYPSTLNMKFKNGVPSQIMQAQLQRVHANFVKAQHDAQ